MDAISWVLGEQSHKSLRAERMSDCIFNGTTKRPPMGMAEVTITMEDPELAEAARFVMETAAEPEATSQANGRKRDIILDLPAEALRKIAGFRDWDQETAKAGRRRHNDCRKPDFKGKKKKKTEKLRLVTNPGEVVVSRRLYRSGQSEYLINGRVGRLRDIQEMFMGVGLGPDSYAIIEQGRIGQILATKPMERRAIIEEAAGVTKFKTKKRLSEAKLESSKLNLARVNDIVVEVEKQLARSSGRPPRPAAIRKFVTDARNRSPDAGGKSARTGCEAERLGTRLAELTAAETQQAQTIHEKEAEQDRLNQRIYSLDAEIRQNQNVLNHTALEVDRSENRIAFNQTRSAETDRP